MNVRSAIAFAPVNGIPLYHIFGGSATVAGIHTLTAINSGSLPSVTKRFQTENASENIRKSMVGSKCTNMNLSVKSSFDDIPAPMFIGQSYGGWEVKAPTDTADHDPIFPDSIEDMYFLDGNSVLTWDNLGDQVAYIDDLLNFEYFVDTFTNFHTKQGSLPAFASAEGSRNHILKLQLLRGGDTSIYDDFIAQSLSSVGKQLVFKIYNTATRYIQLTFNNVIIEECEMNDALDQDNNAHEIYDITALAGSCVPAILDGVTATSFYGE
jgi:hypothetical protein